MKKIVEGNPALVDEHPHQLSKGALVYWLDQPRSTRVELILTGLFGEDADMEVDWGRFQGAYQEVLELPQWTGNTAEGAKAIAWSNTNMVRRYVEFGDLYKAIRNKNVQVRYVQQLAKPYAVDTKVGSGVVFHYPRPEWTIEVIQLSHLEFPAPENLCTITITTDKRVAKLKIANVEMTFEQEHSPSFRTTIAWDVTFGTNLPSETDRLLLSTLETTRNQWWTILDGLEATKTRLPLEVLTADFRRVINAVLNRDEH